MWCSLSSSRLRRLFEDTVGYSISNSCVAGDTAAVAATGAAAAAAAAFAFPGELSAFFDISSLQQSKNNPNKGGTLPLSTITSTMKLCT